MQHDTLDPDGADYLRLVAALRGMGLVQGARPRIAALTGGVSSLIVRVDDGGQVFCAKSALAKLNVAEDWYAPVHRNQSEVAWMRAAANIVPGSVPRVLGSDPAHNVFAMEWLDPDRHPVWKQQMMSGQVSPETARDVGALLGALHAATADDPTVAAQFTNDADFDALRLDPYLRATATAHPELAHRLLALLDTTAQTQRVLIHGDVSPKNILVGPGGPILLDAECATCGDPAFDLAFCLTHLLLKAVHLPALAPALIHSFQALAGGYLARVTWEPVARIETRTAALLPALALARVDGKSPVEYLRGAEQARVRRAATGLIATPATRLEAFLTRWSEALT